MDDNIHKMIEKYKNELIELVKGEKLKKQKSNSTVPGKNMHPEFATLKIEVFSQDPSLDLGNISIDITKKVDDKEKTFFKGKTNEKGEINAVLLPTDQTDPNDLNHNIYTVTAYHENYNFNHSGNVRVFTENNNVYPIEAYLP